MILQPVFAIRGYLEAIVDYNNRKCTPKTHSIHRRNEAFHTNDLALSILREHLSDTKSVSNFVLLSMT